METTATEPLAVLVHEREATGADSDLIQMFWPEDGTGRPDCRRCEACKAVPLPVEGDGTYVCMFPLPADYPRGDGDLLRFTPGQPAG